MKMGSDSPHTAFLKMRSDTFLDHLFSCFPVHWFVPGLPRHLEKEKRYLDGLKCSKLTSKHEGRRPLARRRCGDICGEATSIMLTVFNEVFEVVVSSRDFLFVSIEVFLVEEDWELFSKGGAGSSRSRNFIPNISPATQIKV